MDNEWGLFLFLVLLLCQKSHTESQTSCPYRCQCFNAVQVLCADGGIASLPRNMSKQVKHFIIINSPLVYLFSRSLEDSPQLTKLVFMDNALKSVHAQAFEHLTELQELEISGNPLLQNLFLGTFSKQENLTELQLNFNGLNTVLPGMFDSLKQLETLKMKGNIISDLPAFLFLNLHNLRVLDLSINKLEAVKRETFAGLARLETLKIDSNLISNLTADTFHNISQLIELHLQGNKISELPDDVFSALTELKVLNLRGNLLTTFSDKLFGFKASNLKELNLKGNRLAELSPLTRLTALTDLILSSNQLSELPGDVFRNLTALENLDLSENRLSSLPELIFNGLYGVKSIHLNKNNLSEVDGNLFDDQVLIQQIYLSDNRLENLPRGLLDPFVIQHTMRLHGNPWRCDCHMWYLHDWVLRNSQDIEMLDRMLCESPSFLSRRPVVSVDKHQLVCRASQDATPDLGGCSIETSLDTVTVKCKVDKCSPLTVKVQLQDDGGSVDALEFKKQPEYHQCGNNTVTESPFE